VDTVAALDFLTELEAEVFVYEEAFHVLTHEPEEYAPNFWKDLFGELARE